VAALGSARESGSRCRGIACEPYACFLPASESPAKRTWDRLKI
jgi:hypothetical protein